MISSKEKKPDTSTPKGAAIIGSNITAIQTALTLAQMGVEVNVITDSVSLGWDSDADNMLEGSSPCQRIFWPLLLRMTSHPLITLHTNAKVESIEGARGDFKIQIVQRPRYIHENICTGCGVCQSECSAKVISLIDGQKITHSAIHAPFLKAKSVPSAFTIDKDGVSPCHIA